MENAREYHSDRLDRIEGIIEAAASRQAEIEDEFVRLLKAQIVLNDNLTKYAASSNARMDRVEQNLGEATDKIKALVIFMDQHFREHREKS